MTNLRTAVTMISVFILMNGVPSVSLNLESIGDWASNLVRGLVFDDAEQLDAELQEILAEFKKSADKIFADTLQRTKEVYKLDIKEDDNRHRQRRSGSSRNDDGELDEFEDIYHLENVKPITELVVTASRDIEVFTVEDVLYFAVTNGSARDTQSEVLIFRWDDESSNGTLIQTLSTADVYDIEPILIEGDVYLAVAESNSDQDFLFPGTVIYQFDVTAREFQYIQMIWTTGAHIVTSLYIEGMPCIFIGGAFYVTDTYGLQQEMSAAYHWLGGHFDRFATFVTHNATDIQAFTIHGRHYLAIANFADVTGSVDINSQILIYDSHTMTMDHFQYIDTHGALDWEYFGFGESRHREHFLAVVNNGENSDEYPSMIYKYYEGIFVVFQCVLTTGAQSWHVISDDNGDFVILALATIHGVEFYEYTGWWFRPTDYQFRMHSLQAPSSSFISLIWNSTFMLGVAEGSELHDGYNVFELSFTKYSPLQQRHTELEAACEEQQERLLNLTTQQEAMMNSSVYLVDITVDGMVVIRGNFNVTLSQPDYVQNLTVNKLEVTDGMLLDEESQARFDAMVELVNNQTRARKMLEDRWENYTMKIDGDQTVTEEKQFRSITVTSEMSVESLRVESGVINSDISLDDLDNNTARINRTQTFTAPITFVNVTMESDLHIDGEINGIDTSTIVTLSRNHTIVSHKFFQGAFNITGDLDVEGTIDDVHVSVDSILLVWGNQTYLGNLTFLNELLFNDSVTIDGLVADVDLSELKRIAVHHDGAHNITGNKNFSKPVTMTSGIVIASGHLIDGVDIELLKDTAMTLSTAQNITGALNFTQDLSILGNLVIWGSINGLYVPDSIVLVDGENEVTLFGELTFGQNVTFNKLWCTDEVDGIFCEGDASGLDILLVTGNQVVDGSIIFLEDIWLAGSSEVTGLVDGVDLPALAADAVYYTGNQNISGLKFFNGSVTFFQNITVEEYLQGVNLTELFERALKFSDGKLEALGQLVLLGPTIFEDTLETNGKHDLGNMTLSDLVIQGLNEDIDGFKCFVGDVLSDGFVNVTGHVNNIYLQHFFRDAVLTTDLRPRELAGNITFVDNVYVAGDLTVLGLIDGVNLTAVVRINGTQIIIGETIFAKDLHAVTLVIDGSLTVTGLLNEVNVSDIAADTLMKLGDQTVESTKFFQDGLAFGDDMTIDGLLVELNITELADDAVYKTGDHVVYEMKNFLSLTQIHKLYVTGTVNMVDIQRLYNNTVQQHKSQTISGNNTFLSDVVMMMNLTVLGAINGYVLQEEVDNMVFITDTLIYVEIYFRNVSSYGNVDIGGLIDSVDVSEDAVLTNVPNQVITASKIFNDSVILLAHLQANTVCGIDIKQLVESIVYNEGDQTITAHKTYTVDIVLKQNLHVDGLVAGVNLTYLARYAMRTDDDTKPEQRVTVEASMNNVNVFEVVYYNGTLDGVDLVHLNQTYLSLTMPQTINATKIFNGTVQIASTGSFHGDNITLRGYINGIHLSNFAARVFLIGAGHTVHGTKIFVSVLVAEGDVIVGGHVDGIDLSNNVLRIDTMGLVSGYKNFTGGLMVVNSAIIMDQGRLVDGVDVSEWNKFAAKVTDNYVVPITISIDELELKQNLIVFGLIDDISMGFDSVLTTIMNQTVTGLKGFVTDVVIVGGFSVHGNGTINGVDVGSFFEDTLLKSRDQLITGVYTLASEPTFYNVTTLGLVNDVNVLKLYPDIHTYPSFDRLNASLSALCKAVDSITAAQDNVAVILEHLQFIQEIPTIGHGRWHGFVYQGLQWLVEGKSDGDSDNCVDSYVYFWDETRQNYVLETTLELSMASDVDSFVRGDRLFLVLSSLGNDSYGCYGDDWTLSVPDADPDDIITLEEATLPGQYLHNGVTAVLVRSNSTSKFFLYQHLPSIFPSDVETFVDPHTWYQCVAIANERDVFNSTSSSHLYVYIYCMDDFINGFFFIQAIPSFGAKKVSHFMVNGVLHLAIANYVDIEQGTFLTTSAIWWQSLSGKFLQLDTVETSAAIDVVVTNIEEDTYVIFANEFQGTIGLEEYDAPVRVYKFIEGAVPYLDWRQDISASGARSLGHFAINEQQHFLLVLDRHDTITVYRFSGIKMFEKVHSISVYGATNLEVILLPHDNRIQVAVMSYAQDPITYPEQRPRPIAVSSMILEAIIEDCTIYSGVIKSDECSLVASLPIHMVGDVIAALVPHQDQATHLEPVAIRSFVAFHSQLSLFMRYRVSEVRWWLNQH